MFSFDFNDNNKRCKQNIRHLNLKSLYDRVGFALE